MTESKQLASSRPLLYHTSFSGLSESVDSEPQSNTSHKLPSFDATATFLDILSARSTRQYECSPPSHFRTVSIRLAWVCAICSTGRLGDRAWGPRIGFVPWRLDFDPLLAGVAESWVSSNKVSEGRERTARKRKAAQDSQQRVS